MSAPFHQNEEGKQTDLPRYRGLHGAISYGLFIGGLLVGTAAIGYAAVVFATGNQGLAGLVFVRLAQIGVITGLAAAFSRWVCGGTSLTLYSPSLVKGDMGGITGWLAGLIVAGILTEGSTNGFFVKEQAGIIGKAAAIAGPTVDGGQFDLKDHKGKVVLIDFWATWCGPCIAEIPNIDDAYHAFHDKGLEVVSVSLDSDKATLNRFLKKNPHPWPQIFFDKEGQLGFDNPLAKKYGIDSIPRIWLVNQEGNIVASNLRGENISREVGKLLGESPSWSLPRNITLFSPMEWLLKGMLFSPTGLFWGCVLGGGVICSLLEALIRRATGN